MDYFARLFATRGTLTTDPPMATLRIHGQPEARTFMSHISIPYNLNVDCDAYDFVFKGVNAFEFASLMRRWCDAPMMAVLDHWIEPVHVRVSGDIYEPAHASDAGADLAIISHVKTINSTTDLYDTGVTVSVPLGYYVEVVPRSSIVKTGYSMTNSVGIIDVGYTGTIKIALTRIAPDAQPITLPCKVAQIVVRKQYRPVLVATDRPFDETCRASGGFGSTTHARKNE